MSRPWEPPTRSTQLENRVGLGPGGEGKAEAGTGGGQELRGQRGAGPSPRVSLNGDQSSWRPPAHLRWDIINLGTETSGLPSGERC